MAPFCYYERIHGKSVFVSLLSNMEFVVWIVTYLCLTHLGNDKGMLSKRKKKYVLNSSQAMRRSRWRQC